MKLLRVQISLTLLVMSFAFHACKDKSEDPAPVIDHVSPGSGAAGTAVIITGKFFSTDASRNVLAFNGTAAIVSNATETELMTTVPANATTGKLTLSVNGLNAESVDFTVTTAPTFTGFAPSSGVAGTKVTITGTGFDAVAANNVIRFNGTAAQVDAATATTTSLTVTVPASASTGKISVTINDVTLISTTDFTVTLATPAITGFVPGSGAVGTKVTITGTYFDAVATNNVVKFNGTLATIDAATATTTSLTITVPAGATTGPISVTTDNVTGTSATAFIVSAPAHGWRVKQEFKNGNKIKEHVYDANNRLMQTKLFIEDDTDPANPVLLQYRLTEYFYDASGRLSQVLTADLDTPNQHDEILDYVYSANGQLLTISFSKDLLIGSTLTKTLMYFSTFTYANGKISKTVQTTVSNNLTTEIDYVYSTIGGDPALALVYKTNNFTNTETYYAEENPDPVAHVDPGSIDSYLLLQKSHLQAGSATSNFNFNVTFTKDGNGNINKVVQDYFNHTAYGLTLTYEYEYY